MTAQKLRYFDILLINPWVVRLEKSTPVPISRPTDLRVGTEWLERVSPQLHGRTTRKIDRLRQEQFDTVTDAIWNAVRIPQDRTLVPEQVQAACAYGLEQIFGPASALKRPRG